MSDQVWPSASMMLTTSGWAHIKSFSLIPITNDCPYVEVLFNPMEKTLAIIGKTKKDTFHMVPRLDDNGEPMKLRTSSDSRDNTKKQRIQQESYTEYYITEMDEIKNFIKAFAINHESFDYEKVLNTETMSDPQTLATGPQLIL